VHRLMRGGGGGGNYQLSSMRALLAGHVEAGRRAIDGEDLAVECCAKENYVERDEVGLPNPFWRGRVMAKDIGSDFVSGLFRGFGSMGVGGNHLHLVNFPGREFS